MLLVGMLQRLAAQIQPLVSDWQMSHSRLGRWAVFGGEPEGSDATTHNISHCLLFLIVLMLQMLPVPFCLARVKPHNSLVR